MGSVGVRVARLDRVIQEREAERRTAETAAIDAACRLLTDAQIETLTENTDLDAVAEAHGAFFDVLRGVLGAAGVKRLGEPSGWDWSVA